MKLKELGKIEIYSVSEVNGKLNYTFYYSSKSVLKKDFDSVNKNIEELVVKPHFNVFLKSMESRSTSTEADVKRKLKNLYNHNKNIFAEFYLTTCRKTFNELLKFLGIKSRITSSIILERYERNPAKAIAKFATNALTMMLTQQSEIQSQPLNFNGTLQEWKGVLLDIHFYLAVKGSDNIENDLIHTNSELYAPFDLKHKDHEALLDEIEYTEYVKERYNKGKEYFGKYFDDLWY